MTKLAKKFFVTTAALAATLAITVPSFADNADSQTTGVGNSAAQCQTNNGGARRRGHGHHHAGGMRAFKAISELPSLTPEQKQQIDQILSAYKDEVKPLREQAKALRAQAGSDAAPGSAAPNAVAQDGASVNAKLADLRQQLKEKTHATMAKISSVLTADQKAELKSLRQQRMQKHQKTASSEDNTES